MKYISACKQYCEKNGMKSRVFKKTDEPHYSNVKMMMNDNKMDTEKKPKKLEGMCACAEKSGCSCQSGHGLFTLLASVGIPLLVDAITGNGLNQTGQGQADVLSKTEKKKLQTLFKKELKKAS